MGVSFSTKRNEKRRYNDRINYNKQQRELRKLQSAESFRDWRKRVSPKVMRVQNAVC